MTNSLPARNKKILIRKIRQCKKRCFPGTGGGTRLADEIGVPPQTVLHWLKGIRTPTVEQLYRLAKVFGVSPLELCGIREKDMPTRNTEDIALLRSLLDVLEYAIKHDVDSNVDAEAMESINCIVVKEMETMKDKFNGDLA